MIFERLIKALYEKVSGLEIRIAKEIKAND